MYAVRCAVAPLGALCVSLVAASGLGASPSWTAFAGAPVNGFRPDVAAYVPSKEEAFFEQWQFLAWPEEGGLLSVVLSVHNGGPGSEKPGIAMRYVPPTGRAAVAQASVDGLESQAEPFRLAMRGAELRAEGGVWKLVAGAKEMRVEIELTPDAPAYQPGDGTIRGADGKGGSVVISMLVPRGRVSGTLEVGGKKLRLAGFGYLDHVEGDLPLRDFSRRWRSARMHGPEWSAHFVAIEMPPGAEPRHVGFALVTGNSGPRFASARCQFAGEVPPVEREVGSVDAAWTFLCEGEGGATLRGKLRPTRVLFRASIYDTLSGLDRLLAKAFAKQAIGTVLLEEHALELSSAQAKGEAKEEAKSLLTGSSFAELLYLE